jgi:hypothetical protein
MHPTVSTARMWSLLPPPWLLFLGRGCMGWEVSGMHGQHECINHAVHRLLHGGKAEALLALQQSSVDTFCMVTCAKWVLPIMQAAAMASIRSPVCSCEISYPADKQDTSVPSRPGTPPRGSGNSHRFVVAGRPTSSITIALSRQAVTPCFLRNVCPQRPVSTNPGSLAGADVHHIRFVR